MSKVQAKISNWLTKKNGYVELDQEEGETLAVSLLENNSILSNENLFTKEREHENFYSTDVGDIKRPLSNDYVSFLMNNPISQPKENDMPNKKFPLTSIGKDKRCFHDYW